MKLTLPQQDVYFEQLLYGEEPIYNIGAKAKIEGEINIELFNKAYTTLIKQHDSYRTVFSKLNETISTKIIDNFEDELEFLDLSSHKNPEQSAKTFIKNKFVKPFDITSGCFLYKFILIKVSKNLHYLFMVCHHIITDGWGTSLMFQRLVKNYNEVVEFGKVISTYPYSYIDFVKDDEKYQKSEDYNRDREYWVKKFNILPENLFEKKQVNNQLNRSSRKTLYIKRNQYNKLNTLAKVYKSSTFHLLLALLYIYFGKKNQNHDFAIGLSVLNRSKSTFKKTVGLFMGVSPLRIELNFEDTIQELIITIKNQLRQDYRHQRFPLGKLIQELQVFQEKEKIFNITLSYEKQNYASNFGDTKTTVIPLTHQSERVALAIYIREFDDNEDVKIDFDYNLNYFDDISISQVTLHFENLLKNVLDTPNLKLKELNYLTIEEEHQLLNDFNNTYVEYPKDKTLLYFFNKQVKKYPNKTALFDRNKKYSYLELDIVSNKIAEYILNSSEEEKTSNIGVLLDRSATTVAIMLGILKAGKSFIPLDPTFPDERLKYIIDHSTLKMLISDQELIGFPEITTIKINDLLASILSLKGKTSISVKSTDTAYVIYTSGSTGKPKGVEIGHKALLNFLLSMQQTPGIQDTDTLFAVTTYSFDISILEFFVPLISGACVYIASNETLKDPEKTIQTIEKINPSIIQATPSFYQLLFNAGWKGNKRLKVLCGGDLLSEDLAGQLLKDCGSLWNMYGPTETTIWSSVKQITTEIEASNIGSPVKNTQFYILDTFKKLLPIGSNGSLYIGGDGLAKGYFKDSELTQQKFIPNPFEEGTLFYDTNDVAKWNANGELEFLGRNDNQVKIRGYRIELGEIETKLNNFLEIRQAIVIAKKHKNQDAFLVAYIIKENENYKESNCIEALEKELPKYMIPYTFLVVEKFPLTPNKKVDRKVLAQKEIIKSTSREGFQQPKTILQERLLEYWKGVLHYGGDISVRDNFFSLGGHSLNAVKLIYLINNELQYAISLKTLFDFPTITSLSNHLSTIDNVETQTIPISVKKKHYAITPSQYEIWLASQHTQRSIAYNMIAAFNIDGKINIKKINRAVNQLILEHEILRTNFTEINGNVYQKINKIKTVDFNISLEQSDEDKVLDSIRQFINCEFNLEQGLLIKMQLIQMSETRSVLVFCTHHIIMDGWSLERFTQVFLQYYANNSRESSTHENEQIQFKDYTEWFASFIKIKEETSFWKSYLKGYQVKESFVSDHILDKEAHKGNHFRFELNLEETVALKYFLRKQKTTMHNFLIASLNIFIFKFSQHEDIVLGTVNSGRERSELNKMIGMFVKTLPLRIKISKEYSFNEVLEVVQEGVLQIDNNQNIPKQYRKKELFDILVAFQNPDFSYQESIKLKGAKLNPYPIDVKYSRLPLLFNFFETNNVLSAILSYNTDKYDKATIELIVLKYKKLINEIILNPLTKIVDLDISLDFEKKNTIEIDFNF